jgi:hypothetical protein
MKKLAVAFIVGGGALAIGGVLFLLTKGYNISTMQPWESVFNLALRAPSSLIGAAIDNPRAEMFRGFLGVVFGFTIAFVGIVLILLSSAAEMFRSSMKRSRAKREGKADDVPASPRPKKEKVKKKRQPLAFSLPFKGDKSVDLEDGVFAKLKDKIAAIIAAAKKARKKKSSTAVIVSSGDKDEVIAEIPSASEFHADLQDWHTRVKKSGGHGSDLVEEAKVLRKRATDHCLKYVRNEDPMNSEFMIRMMNAWAEKLDNAVRSNGENRLIDADREMSVLASAIEDVSRNGVSAGGHNDEEEMDLEDGDDGAFLNPKAFDQAIGDEAVEDDDEEGFLSPGAFEKVSAIDPIPDQVADLDDDEDDDEEASDTPTEETDVGEQGDEASSIVSAAFSFVQEVKIVSEGEGEWPEEFADQQDRVIALEEAIEGVRGLLEQYDDDDIGALLAEHENEPEWEWIAQIRGDIDREKNRIMELVVDSGADDADDDDDIESSFSVTLPKVSASDTEAPVAASEEEGQEEPDADAGHDDVIEEKAPEEIVEAEPSVKIEVEQSVETPAEAKAQQAEPMDLSVGELLEVECADEALMKWGMMAKAAGASEAKLVHTMLDREGSKRKVVGVVHMVAGWIDESGEDLKKKMNLVFRFVPEGEWHLEAGSDIRMVDELGNWVGVDTPFLNHKDLAGHKTVIHFHGPGVKDDTLNHIQDGLFVTGRVMNAEEIRKAVLES